MSASHLINGRLYSPYLICIRSEGYFSDADLLSLFGLHGYHPPADPDRFRRHALLVDAGAWTVLADDWYYTLWNMSETRPTIAALGESWDVFACSVGDTDRSFDFVYYQGSQLVRRYVVEDPHARGRVVVVDEGNPLPGEAAAFSATNGTERVLGVAQSLGIPTVYNEQDVRVYAPVEPDRR